jgi:hypothetical protein
VQFDAEEEELDGRIRKSKKQFERWQEKREGRKRRRQQQKILQFKQQCVVMQRTDTDFLDTIGSRRLHMISLKLKLERKVSVVDEIEIKLLHDEAELIAKTQRSLVGLRKSAFAQMEEALL